MKTQDKKEIRQIFNEGLEQLVLPILDDIYSKMATKKDLENMATKEDVQALSNDVDSINRKLDAEIDWRDESDKRFHPVKYFKFYNV